MPRKKASTTKAASTGPRRRSSRLSGGAQVEATQAKAKDDPPPSDSESEEENDDAKRFEFEGTVYGTYQEMVNAKRKRNEDYLKQNGLWKPTAHTTTGSSGNKEASRNGIKRRKVTQPRAPARKSNRLAGTPADGNFVEHEGGGNFVIVSSTETTTTASSSTGGVTTTTRTTRNSKTQQSTTVIVTGDRKDNPRVNDGAPLSIQDAIQHCDPKWIQETSVAEAERFTREILRPSSSVKESAKKDANATTITRTDKSPTSVTAGTGIAASGNLNMDSIRQQVEQLSIDDDDMVAKVTPDRIYSVAAHPSKTHLVVGAGDKLGYVGLWNVDNNGQNNQDSATDGVHLFRPHTRPVNTLEWTAQGLLSSSYDGTVRYFDIAKESFEEVFATNPGDSENFYTQYLALDSRASIPGQSFFLSTSMGSVMHVDRRVGGTKGSVTFHALMSEKKINSVSLHRDGYCLATAGLDRTVKLWDLRKLGDRGKSKKALEPYEPKQAFLGEHDNRLSVNSAFFSPSGEYLLTTNMANTLNVYHKAHLHQAMKKGSPRKKNGQLEPKHVIRHNNHTGRWLATFMAQWHPTLDLFCVGSMAQPRAIDVYDGALGAHIRAIQGEAISSVSSRCCFHTSSDGLVIVGGNSSGRVTIIR